MMKVDVNCPEHSSRPRFAWESGIARGQIRGDYLLGRGCVT